MPFSLEVGGAWGPAAKRFFNTCVKLAGDDRDIDLYHWSSERFSSAWVNTISVLLAKRESAHYYEFTAVLFLNRHKALGPCAVVVNGNGA